MIRVGRSILNRVESFSFENCIPIYVTFEITLKCNLRCVHCYNFDRSKPAPRARTEAELRPDEIKRVISEIAGAGGMFLAFTGGEALAHPHLDEFVMHAHDHGLVPRLKTNAILLTSERAKALRARGLQQVDVSVYGASPETHDEFTQQSGSFVKTLAGIRAAHAAGLDTTMNFILHRGCFSEAEKMVALARELAVRFNISTELTHRNDGDRAPNEHRLSRQQLRELYGGPLSPLFSTSKNFEDGLQCSCARTVCGIASNGDVYPCIGAPVWAGSLRVTNFGDIWKNSAVFARIRGLKLDDFSTCKTCLDRKYCQRSSGAIYINTGNYTGADEWSCLEASVLREIDERDSSAPN